VSTVPPIPSVPSSSFSSLSKFSLNLIASLSRIVVLEAPVSTSSSTVSCMSKASDFKMAAT